MANTVLGIHSNTSGMSSGGSAGGPLLIDGHGWISVYKNGRTEYHGLWPDSHQDVPDNGRGSDVRVGLERSMMPDQSRYYLLSAEQEVLLRRLLRRKANWGYTNNCSSWATELIRKVTKENVRASEPVTAYPILPIIAFVDTPRTLGNNLRALERKDPTNLLNPRGPNMSRLQASSQSSFGR